jgi:hypothetical protein
MEALGQAVVVGRGGAERQELELLRKMRSGAEYKHQGSEAISRVLAKTLDGEECFFAVRDTLRDLLLGKTAYKLVLQRQHRKRHTRPSLALEVAHFVDERIEIFGLPQKAAVDDAKAEFGLERRRILELLKEGRQQIARVADALEGRGANVDVVLVQKVQSADRTECTSIRLKKD